MATALSGITLERALEPEEGPSSITRSGLTVQIPPGWEEVSFNAGRPALSSAIAAGPPEDTNAGFVVGKLGSETAAERMLEGAQAWGGGRTEVRLGKLHAWRYAGLRPRPQLAGTGYLLPTTAGAVVMVCHASKDDARIRLAECERAATTLVVHGERPRRLASVDRSNERLVGVIATLRATRSGGRQRLALPDLAPSQIRAATSLERSHRVVARSLDGISRVEDKRSLGNLAAALRAAADAYGRLAGAATLSSGPAYREARHAVVRREEAVRRELARAATA